MITGALLLLIYVLVFGLISILPTGATLDQTIVSSAQTLGQYLANVNAFLPVDTLITIITYSAVIMISLLTWRLVKYITNTVRGAGA